MNVTDSISCSALNETEDSFTKSSIKRVLVGTLYSKENEYSECRNSIIRQTYSNYDHIVIQDLPNKEAHVALFRSFLERSDKYDLLIKVDADMVLLSPDLFGGIVKKMNDRPDIQVLSIAVQDYFSDQLIFGLNAYRNTVRWDFSKENLFVDIPLTEHKYYLFDSNDLAPAAIHSGNPSPYHAFHYGVHRGLKVVQPEQTEIRESSRRAKWTGLEHTWKHYLQNKDMRLGLACLGAELAYAGVFQLRDLDINNPKTERILSGFIKMKPAALGRIFFLIRFLNFGFFHSSKRRELICHRAYLGKKNLLISWMVRA